MRIINKWIIVTIFAAIFGGLVLGLAQWTGTTIAIIAGAISGPGLMAIYDYLFGPQTAIQRLSDTIESSVNANLKIDESNYQNSSLYPLVRAVNHYGVGVNQLVGQASNKANGIVLVSKFLADSAHQVNTAAEEQAEHASGLASTMEEMTATTREIAHNAAQTSEATAEVAEANTQGISHMETVAESVRNVSQMFSEFLVVMGELHTASNEIGNVVQVINGIAEQTNLLALNAAIEAARAGEQGRGFAVVADEVRTLANRTTDSTKEITETINRNRRLTEQVVNTTAQGQEMVDRSVEQSNAAMTTLQTASNSVSRVNDMIHQIAAATKQQLDTVNDITAHIDGVNVLAQDTITRARGSHQASLGLENFAKEFETHVNRYDLNFLGLVPLENAVTMNASFDPLCDFINSVLGQSLFIRLGHDYDEAINDLGTGRALISYQTPSTYIEAHDKYDVEPLAVPLAKGEPFYHSAIVVRSDSGITDLSQLSGKRFAFGDAKSTGSKAMPQSMLKGAGVELRNLANYGFLGSHDNVANAVLSKEYDGGGLMMTVAEKYTAKGLTILAGSDPIPQFPICASPALSKQDREKLVHALIGLKDDKVLKALGAQITGFAPIKDSDYDGVRAMLKTLAS